MNSLIPLLLVVACCAASCRTAETGSAVFDASVLPGDPSRSDPGAARAETTAGPGICGDGIVTKGEACDPGTRQDGLCTATCEWRFCKLEKNRNYVEDEFPLAVCLKKVGASSTEVACANAVALGATDCYDCRGSRAACAPRLRKQDEFTAGAGLADDTAFSDFAVCAAYALQDVLKGGRDAFGVPKSPYRFGYDLLATQRTAHPTDVGSWCVPKTFVNCAKWDAPAGTWKAPLGCACYSERAADGRTYDNCNDLAFLACPWASGSGCGLHFLGSHGGVGCSVGPDPRANPQHAECHIDISGTKHDFCCAKHWYVDKSITWYGENISKWECNGCNGGNGGRSCSNWYVFHNFSSPRNDELPCRAEWDQAVAHNDTFGGSRYQWRRVVDTEQRQSFAENQRFNGTAAILGAIKPGAMDYKADAGQPLLKVDYTYGSTSREEAAAFCKSGRVKDELRTIGVDVTPTKMWVCAD